MNLNLGPIGQISRSVQDITQSETWYRTVLGLPHLIHKHADGTEEYMTFFKDPEGRLLALMSQVR